MLIGKKDELTYRCVVGLGNETVVVFAINLDNRGVLRVEAGIDGDSSKQSRCNGDGGGMDHFVDLVLGIRNGLTTIEAVAAMREINS